MRAAVLSLIPPPHMNDPSLPAVVIALAFMLILLLMA